MSKICHTNGIISSRFPSTQHMDDSFDFDSHTNPDLYSEVYSNPSAYSITDGVLTKDGAPVTINDWCDDCKTLDAVLNASEATNEQLTKALKLLVQKPGFTKG